MKNLTKIPNTNHFELQISVKCSLQRLFVMLRHSRETKKKHQPNNKCGINQQVKGKMQHRYIRRFVFANSSNRLKRMDERDTKERQIVGRFTRTHSHAHAVHMECERERTQNKCEIHWNFSSLFAPFFWFVPYNYWFQNRSRELKKVERKTQNPR